MPDNIKPEISVIIPCKNHARELRKCLAGCRRMQVDIPFEIIVVDSAADPDVLSAVSDFPEANLLRSEDNLDAASARNLGVRHAKSNLFAFIDADCVPNQKWLIAAFKELSRGIKMVGGPVTDAFPFRPVASADNILQFAELSEKRPKGDIEFLPGCNIGVQREAFETIGGFPVAQFIEDVLFTSKIASLWPDKCKFLPDMHVFHKGRQNLTELWNHNYHFGYRRGIQGFRITKKQQNLGRFRSTIPLVILKRLTFIFSSILRWNRKKASIYFILLPLIIIGLIGYAIGFQRGCQKSYKMAGL